MRSGFQHHDIITGRILHQQVQQRRTLVVGPNKPHFPDRRKCLLQSTPPPVFKGNSVVACWGVPAAVPQPAGQLADFGIADHRRLAAALELRINAKPDVRRGPEKSLGLPAECRGGVHQCPERCRAVGASGHDVEWSSIERCGVVSATFGASIGLFRPPTNVLNGTVSLPSSLLSP